jgi:predicted RNA-binding protein with PUA-like domain
MHYFIICTCHQILLELRREHEWQGCVEQCFSNFVRPQSGKFFFYKSKARSQQIVGLQAIFMTGHKQRYYFSRMLKDFDVRKFVTIHKYFDV